MKPFSKTTNKWILSTLMIAALGSQYYFSVSSNSFGQFELSSTAAEELAAKFEEINKLYGSDPVRFQKEKDKLIADMGPKVRAELKLAKEAQAAGVKQAVPQKDGETKELEVVQKPAATETATASKPTEAAKPTKITVTNGAATVAAPAEKKKETEGKSFEITCTDCGEGSKPIVISNVNLDTATKFALLLNPKAKKEEDDDEPKEKETRLEKMRREREERREKRLLEKEENEEKELEKLEIRRERFEEKIDNLVSRCKDDLECKIDGLNTQMQSYIGSNRLNRTDMVVAFNKLGIGPELASSLRNSNGEGLMALTKMKEFMTAVPAEYNSLKSHLMGYVANEQSTQVSAITDLYGNPSTRLQALQAEQTFRTDAGIIANSLRQGANDSESMTYFRNTYLPSIDRLMSSLPSLGNRTTSNGTTVSDRIGSGRVGRGGSANINNGGAIISNDNNLSGVNFGPTSASPTVQRRGRQLSN